MSQQRRHGSIIEAGMLHSGLAAALGPLFAQSADILAAPPAVLQCRQAVRWPRKRYPLDALGNCGPAPGSAERRRHHERSTGSAAGWAEPHPRATADHG